MATRTLGTNANNTLTPILTVSGSMAASSVASLNAAIKDDLNVAHPLAPMAFNLNADIEITNRIDNLYLRAGDVVLVDPNGWPIILSAKAAASGPWTVGASTGGTNANNSLTAVKFGADLTPADLATIQQGIKDDLTNTNPIFPGAFGTNGLLFLPNRGCIQVLPGDYVAFDSTGWPILVSANSIAGSGWTHT